MTSSGIVRAPRPDSHFTNLRNEVLRDERLSYRARGLLAAILSRPDDWRTTADSLAREGKEGRAAILNALGELEVAGYLVRRKHQDKATGHWRTSSMVFDVPQVTEFTEVQFPNVGSPNVGEPTVGEPKVGLFAANRRNETKKRNKESITSAEAEADEPVTVSEPDDIQPTNAGEVVKAYVDEFVGTHGSRPPAMSLRRIGRDAKQMLGEGQDFQSLINAAQEAARGGHGNLASALTRVLAMNARRSQTPAKESGTSVFLRVSGAAQRPTRKELEQ